MTDPDLVRLAEQAYLGAVLARQGQALAGPGMGLPTVHAGDFADPVHQAIFAALTGQPGTARPAGPAGLLGRLRDLLERLLSGQARQAAAYMAELPGLCPDSANLPAYAAMVAESSRHRASQARSRENERAEAEDPTLASAGAWLDSTGTVGRRQARPVAAHVTGSASATQPTEARPDQAAAGLAPETARLARALRADARKAAPRFLGQEHAPGGAPGRRTPSGPVDLAIRHADPAAPFETEELQERVLAGLMRHPAEGQAVTRWLPAEAFSSAPLRDLYDLIRHRLADGRPQADPLIIAWDASGLPESPAAEEGGGAAVLARLALRVGALDPAPGTAEVIGRALWAERILTGALGRDWPGQRERIGLVTALAAGDEPALQPGPVPVPAPVEQAAASVPAGPGLQAGPDLAAAVVPGQTVGGPVAAAATPVAAQPSASERSAPARRSAPAQVQVQQPPAPAPSGPGLRM